jgi:hypothetical protein
VSAEAGEVMRQPSEPEEEAQMTGFQLLITTDAAYCCISCSWCSAASSTGWSVSWLDGTAAAQRTDSRSSLGRWQGDVWTTQHRNERSYSPSQLAA